MRTPCTRNVRVASIALLLGAATAVRSDDSAFLVHDVEPSRTNPGPALGANHLDSFFFLGSGASGVNDLWATGGGYLRTVRNDLPGECVTVHGSRVECFPQGLVSSGDWLFLVGHDDAHGVELWRTGPCSNCAQLVKDVNPGPGDGLYTRGESAEVFAQLTDVGGTLFFVANEGDGPRRLWKSKGSAASTQRVRSFSATPRNLTAAGGVLWFSVGGELWKSDGTGTGTIRVKTFPEPIFSFAPHLFAAVGDTLFFTASDGTHGHELWKARGSTASLVADILPGPAGSRPTEIVELHEKAYFFVEGDASREDALWSSDGTAAGTRREIDGFPAGSVFSTGDRLFVVSDGALWSSDGTAEGTEVAFDGKDGEAGVLGAREVLGLHDEILYFTADGPAENGFRLWGLSVPDQCRHDAIVDNGSPGTQAYGTWRLSEGAPPYGPDSLWSRAYGTTVPRYLLHADLVPGTYEVLEWHPALSTRSASVPHVISNGFSFPEPRVLVNQRVGGGRWNSLGAWPFATGGQVEIRAEDRVGSTGADAVRFTCLERLLPAATIESITPSLPEGVFQGTTIEFRGRGAPWLPSVEVTLLEWTSDLQPGVLLSTQTFFSTPDLLPGKHTIRLRALDRTGAWSLPASREIEVLPLVTPCEAIVDDTSPGATAIGSWSYSSAPGSFGSFSRWTKPSTGTGQIHFIFRADLAPGRYEVFEWHSIWATRSRAVQHEISSAGSVLKTVTVDQSVNGGRWNSLGTYAFAASGSVKILATDTARSTNADAVRFVCRP